MMYTCEESELGGVRSYSISDGREIIARKLAERNQGKPARPAKPAVPQEGEPGERLPVGNGTPLGRAFRKFLG